MKVKMNRTQIASTNGINHIKFSKGEVYDLSERLYAVFVKQMEIASPVNDADKDSPVNDADEDSPVNDDKEGHKMVPVPENKMAQVSENKQGPDKRRIQKR